MCAECGQMFTRLGHLRRHTRLHTGDKPFMCNRCACQFARADHLRRHLQAHHADDPTLRPKDPNSANDFLANIKSELDGVPLTSGDNLPLVGIPGGNDQSESGPSLNLPVFPGPEMEKFDTPLGEKSRQREMDTLTASGDHLAGFSVLSGDENTPSEIRVAQSVPVFPGREVEKLTSGVNQSDYEAVDILANLQHARLDAGKLITNKDRNRTTTTTSSISYETAMGVSLPIFSRHREEKSATRYPAVEIPAELKSAQSDGRKSATTEDCDHVASVSRFQESASSNPALSLPEHRSFPVSADSAPFRAADFWQRTSPAYMNDRLFLAGAAANLRHFDVDFSRSPEPTPTNLARRYSQSHSMMPGNFLTSVVDFRRLPPESPVVTSQPSDTAIPDASPLSLARYQRK